MKYTIKNLRKTLWRADVVTVTYGKNKIQLLVESEDGNIISWEGRRKSDQNVLRRLDVGADDEIYAFLNSVIEIQPR